MEKAPLQKAMFGAGCFWGVEDFFLQVPGVSDAVSGYAGGTSEAPTYRQVCGGDTYHAEVVEVTFDPARVAYRTLVELFFRMHNPTTRNRQGPDVGTQYRSTVFPASAEQERVARSYIAQLDQAKVFAEPIVTTLETGKTFYPAENYHQDFLTLNPTYPYIVYNDLPKVANLKQLFPALYSEKPVLVLSASN